MTSSTLPEVRRVLAGRRVAARHGGVGGVLDAVESWTPDVAPPPSALLVVRRVHARLGNDGALSSDVSDIASRAWPMRRGPAPDDAQAVLFDDTVDVVVALADVVASHRSPPWWVATVLGTSARGELAAFTSAAHRWPHAVPVACRRAPVAMSEAFAALTPDVVLALAIVAAATHGADDAWVQQVAATPGAEPRMPEHATAGVLAERTTPTWDTTGTPSSALDQHHVAALSRTAPGRAPGPGDDAAPRSLAVTIVESLAALAAPRPTTTTTTVLRPTPTARTTGTIASAPSPLTAQPGAVGAADGDPRHPRHPRHGQADEASTARPDGDTDHSNDPTADGLAVATRLGGASCLMHLIERAFEAHPDVVADNGSPWRVLHDVLLDWGRDDGVLGDDHSNDPLFELVRGRDETMSDTWSSAAIGRWSAHLLDELHGHHVSPAVIEVPATVTVDDLFMRWWLPMERIDIDVRRAGLDRSPGWLPRWRIAVEIEFR